MSSTSCRTNSCVRKLTDCLVQLNTEATADSDHQSAGGLPILHAKAYKAPWSVTEDAVEIPMRASAGTIGLCTNNPVSQIDPCILMLFPPLPGHRRSQATLCWKHDADSGGRLGSSRAVPFRTLTTYFARSSVSAPHAEKRASSTTSVGWHQGCVWTVSMCEFMYLSLVLAHTWDRTSTVLLMLYSFS